MPKDFTSTTFSEVYRDDYSDSAGYHRILFNSGRPLQARELTQLQTILQNQITRFGQNIFLDGAAVGSPGAGIEAADYVILENLPSGINASDYIGTILQGPATSSSSGLQFIVTHAEEATDDGDNPTLYGSYRSYNQSTVNEDVQDSNPTFAEADELQDIKVISGLEGQPNVVVRTKPPSYEYESVGKGLLFGCQSGNFWTQGFFVYAQKQIIAISKYEQNADVDVGFDVIQDIVTVDDTDDLYDNQGAVPNLSSPGADRYRIRLKLTTKGSTANPYKFVLFATVRNGVITYKKEGDDSFNQIEKRMAVRHSETHGDFIANPFDIQYKPGDSSGSLSLVVAGDVKGLNPTAFVDGYRLRLYNNETIQVNKPTTYTEEPGTSLKVDYKNYVNVKFDSAGANYLGLWNGDYTLQDQTNMDLLDGTQTKIGTARVKSLVNTLDDSEGYRVHLYDVTMEDQQNFRDVRTFRPYNYSGDNGVPLTLVAGQLYAEDPVVNTSLHFVPGGRVKSISNLSYSVQRQFQATAAGGFVNITTNSNESFDNLSQWIYINKTTGESEIIAPTNVSLNSSDPQTATINVSGTTDQYTVFAYVQKNSPQPKLKTFAKHGSPISATKNSDDVFVFNLYDGIDLISAHADSANGKDVSDQLVFDGGQRDNYYGKVTLSSQGLASSVSTVYAKFKYFDWGSSGDYFAVNSYVLTDSFGYAQIPTFTSPRTGDAIDLRNHLDLRAKLDTSADTMGSTDRFEIPLDGDAVSYDVQWYNHRIDNISVGYNQVDFRPEIRINKGVEDINPEAPKPKSNEMVLFQVLYGGNTKSTRDLRIKRMRHKRYQMTDIDRINSRVENLEETVSLSFLEQQAINLVELDADGNVRSKTGFFVDDFKNEFALTASSVSPTFQADDALVTERLVKVSENGYSLTSKNREASVQMLYDSDNLFSSRTGHSKSNVVRKGDLLYLDYQEVLDSSLVNEVISWYSDGRSYEEEGWYNVNPFNVFRGEGSLKLSPANDVWSDTYRLPDVNIYDYQSQTESEVDLITSVISGGAQAQDWEWQVSVSESTTTKVDKIEEEVVSYSVPFCRQREVFVRAQGLRPNTRYWPFFDGVNVEQWVLKETQSEYRTHLSNDDHLRAYPEVDVTIKKHPRRVDEEDKLLISDYQGEIYFSFWLPNNAPVPSPSGNSFTSFSEWEEWITKQEEEAARYPAGVSDPSIYDDIGWKFKTGSVPLLLNDVSVPEIDNGLSFALSQYFATGTLNVSQKTIFMTQTTTKTTSYAKVPVDPLAQSFFVDARSGIPGVFVTKVDVFLRRAPQTSNRGGNDLAIPIKMEIREVENGVPVAWPAGPQYVVYKNADEVYDIVNNINDLEDIDDVLSNPVTFEFEEPVHLQAGEEYAIALFAECDDYEAFVSTTYGLVLGKTDERVSEQPAAGSLFLSQNGSTWTPKQNQNMAYRIHTAKFKSSGQLNFYNAEYPRFRHNTARLSVDDSDSTRFRVNQIGHGLGVGDKVQLTGLDSSSTYGGVFGHEMMNANLLVDSADIAGYFVQLDSGSFTDTGWFGADSVTTNTAFNFDEFKWTLMTQEYPTTSINYTGNFITGYSYSKVDETATADPRFDFTGRNIKLRPDNPYRFESPRMVANAQQEYDEISPASQAAPSIVIGADLKVTSTSTFGGPRAKNVSSSGYTADVSPIIDLTRNTFVMRNYLIDNQPLTIADNSTLTNTPHYYTPETHPVEGSGPSKHITKPVVLSQAANGVRVFVNAYVPPEADIDLYYRIVEDADGDLYTVPFVKIDPEYAPVKSSFSNETYNELELKYPEYSYLIGGEDGDLPDFVKFQLKVVMRSTNTCQPPVISSIRAIAVI